MVTSPRDVPLPAGIAARPSDERGYPVPAITPWPDASPAFAQQSAFRTLICLAERRCTVCGTKMPPGPVYRVIDGDMADNIALAMDTGKHYANLRPVGEGPGHLSCMLYSAVVCPHLASPGARRKIETAIGQERLPRGDRRGDQAAVVGFDSYEWQVDVNGLEIFFGRPVEMLSYADGADLVEELAEEVAREPKRVEQCPAYLVNDDAKAESVAKSIITAMINSSPNAASREERARKDRHKAAKTARRRNR
jgi:hypothetical protein